MRTGRDLIICIGNVARGDDGVAHRVAALLRDRVDEAAVRIMAAADLDIAMASDLADAHRFVLVDAERRAQPAVRMQPLDPGPAARPTGHGIDPAGLLGITQVLYGTAPRAVLWSVAAPEMGHGEELSATAEAAALEAAAEIMRYLEASPDG